MIRAHPALRYGTVVFDCDSTLSSIEGIDELARAHRDQVTRLTKAAMRGDVALEDVFARRLELVRPSRSDVAALGKRYVDTIVTDAREVVRGLISEGIAVRVMSGGLLPAVSALGIFLGLDHGDIAAVDVYFDELGAYAGFDRGSPLAYSGGKRVQLESWLPELPPPVMLVGDGVTDLEARPPADTFVAFTGVAHRPAVVAAADVVVRSASLAPVLALALGGIAPRDLQARATFDRGMRLMANGRWLMADGRWISL